MPLSLSEFVKRWKLNSLSERSGAQSHFIDLCEVLAQPHPAAADAVGERYTFEKPVPKVYGGKGFADVWLRDHFAWEYKGKHKDLKAAYKQINDYREDLGNPPLLVVCDLDRFEIHTNYTATTKRVFRFDLDALGKNVATADCPLPPLIVLRSLFDDTDTLRPNRTDAHVTQEAAKVFSKLAERLEIEKRSHTETPIHTKEEIAHFLIQLLFCLFADNIGLLPDHCFKKLVQSDDRFTPKLFLRKLKVLFRAMSEQDGIFGEHTIKYFNGGLFDSDAVMDLDVQDLRILHDAATSYNWSYVAPEIFGTLFERSLNAERRSLIGAHYTAAEDILLLIEPVVMRPLERRWNAVREQALAALLNGKAATEAKNSLLSSNPEAERLLSGWFDELRAVRVLDPACGSGNFLYLALRRLLDLWETSRKFAIEYNVQLAMSHAIDQMVSPLQLFGIERESYAHELASVVVWMGYLQWKREHGIVDEAQPILQRLPNIEHDDAILRYDVEGKPYEPSWPQVDFIIGNPPFLGGKKLRRELGDQVVDDLFAVYQGKVSAESDLVVYWFEKARETLLGSVEVRVGLIATQQIRKGFNQRVLKKISEVGALIWAISDRPWFTEIIDTKVGKKSSRKIAAVRIAMIAFDSGEQTELLLDGRIVNVINPDLTSGVNVTRATVLHENKGVCFQGPTRVGRFDLRNSVAKQMLAAPQNVNGCYNSDVVRPYIRTTDLTDRPRNMYIVDFGVKMTEVEAAEYELPFEHIKTLVKSYREEARSGTKTGLKWWRFQRPRPELRRQLAAKSRAIATPRTSKHRFFTWVPSDIVPDTRVYVIPRESDYYIGVLSSLVHETWSLHNGAKHGVAGDPTYVKETCFDTFPFPWPPGAEPREDESIVVKTIASAARELVAKRDAWLNPPNATEAELRGYTLTRLYNKRPEWLEHAHEALDHAVFAAYGWEYPLPEQEVLARLLALNQERAAAQGLRPAKQKAKGNAQQSSAQ